MDRDRDLKIPKNSKWKIPKIPKSRIGIYFFGIIWNLTRSKKKLIIFAKFPGFMQIFSGFFTFGMSREFFKSNSNQKFFNTIPDFRLFTIFFSKICKKSRIRFSKPILFILIREPRDHKFVDDIWIEFPSRCNFPRNKNRVGRYVARCWILNGIYFVESWVTFVEF